MTLEEFSDVAVVAARVHKRQMQEAFAIGLLSGTLYATLALVGCWFISSSVLVQ